LAALHDALAAPPQVLALGGGTPEIPEARAVLADAVQRSQATIIYLRADADTLAARLRAETGDRPSITRADPAAEVEEVLTRRDPIFRDLATLTIDAGRTPPQGVTKRISESLGAR